MRRLFAVAALLASTMALAADPPWTQQYQFNQSPEGNGFSRSLYDYGDLDGDGDHGPVVTEVTGGSPANRRVEIQSTEGDAVFITSQVPSLDPNVGVTAEWRVALAPDTISGVLGDAGIELTFLSRAVGVSVHDTWVDISICSNTGSLQYRVDTSSNRPATTWRLTFDPSSQVRLYRAGVLVAGPYNAPSCNKPFQRVLWWGESGGTQTYSILRYWSGGAMAP